MPNPSQLYLFFVVSLVILLMPGLTTVATQQIYSASISAELHIDNSHGSIYQQSTGNPNLTAQAR